MKVLTGDPLSWVFDQPTAVTIGVFDGVHLGHQRVMATLVDLAAREDLVPAALTFDPHPLEFLAPERAPKLLTDVEQRIELLEGCGIRMVGVMAFPHIRDLPAPVFAREVLSERILARHVVVGRDFRFGRDRTGDTALLGRLGEELGFRVETVDMVTVAHGEIVSATRIRAYVAAGDVEAAARLLGRPFELRGRVIRGDARGRTLGFPTANLHVPARMAIPADGVYAVWAVVGDQTHPAMANIGVRPTFGVSARTVEAHLLDFDGDLYGKVLRLRFVARLRDEKAFASVEELIDQLEADRRRTVRVLGGRRAG
jgi:riboflavin kinase/FMN adenylyltransferase